MDYTELSVENEIGTVEFFTEKSNSLPASILKGITEKLEIAGKTNGIKVIVLKSGGEKTFCAGASFDELLQVSDEESGKEFFMGFANVINAMRKTPKLIIGRVQGKAIGGGVGLAAACDYCFATENASIKLSELSIGIGPFVISEAVKRKIGLAAFSQLSINATNFYDANWAHQKAPAVDDAAAATLSTELL